MNDSLFSYGATSNVGYGRETNEDYFDLYVFDDDCLLMVIADGMGSKPSSLQPAGIAVAEIMRVMHCAFKEDKDAVLSNPTMFFKLAMSAANRVLCAFKLANEENYSGFGASITCCLIYGRQKKHICFAHTGNTRLYLIRFINEQSVIKQLTKDHTKGIRMLEDGIITAEQYPVHPDRLALTSAIGMVAEPEIQYFEGPVKENDIILMTTKGIHFAVRPEPMMDIALRSGNCEDAVKSLVEAAKSTKYVDNMTAMMVYIPDDKNAK